MTAKKKILAACVGAALLGAAAVPSMQAQAAVPAAEKAPAVQAAAGRAAIRTSGNTPALQQLAPTLRAKKTAKSPRALVGLTEFPAEMPGKVNKKLIRGVHFRLGASLDTPLVDAPAPDTVTIFGPAEATEEQMQAFILRRNPKPKLNGTVEEIVRAYYVEAGREGIRPDVALCQALKETGFFAYGGDVSPKQNNFCGLGATGNREPGAHFATIELGVRAHIQHLLAYASESRPQEAVVDPRYELVVQNHPEIHGKIQRWTGLNGVWAVPGKRYGQDILQLWQQAKAPDGSDISLAAAEQKVRRSPDDASAYLSRGVVYYYRQDYAKAAADFTRALALDGSLKESRYDLALTQERQGDARAAKKTYDALLALAPDFGQAYYNRGMLVLRDRKQRAAIEDFEKVLALNPQFAPAENAIGVAQIAQGKYDAAWSAFHRAAEINYANMDVLGNQFIFTACLDPEK